MVAVSLKKKMHGIVSQLCLIDLPFSVFFFFKQKTAYEIPLRLVGSEMCIRDSIPTVQNGDVVETPDGGMTVKISIVPKARWSDGRPVTCEDIVFTLSLIHI